MAVTEHLYLRWPDRSEGELAPTRAGVVNAATLARAASDIELGRALRLGKGEDGAGGRQRPSILSDALEAVFGAVYLDGGWDAAREVVLRVMEPHISDPRSSPHSADAKTELQEVVAVRFGAQVPAYDHTSTGPDHAKQFRATVTVAGEVRGEGLGRSKKEAEQAAARSALDALASRAGTDDDTTHQGEGHSDA